MPAVHAGRAVSARQHESVAAGRWFRRATLVQTAVYAPAAAHVDKILADDLDGDGNADIVWGQWHYHQPSDNVVWWSRGDGAGRLVGGKQARVMELPQSELRSHCGN